MDNSKLRPHETAKIVHSRYFTAVARLAGERHVYGKHIEEHTGRIMSFKKKKRGGGGGKRKRQEGRIVLYRSLILYIVSEKTKRAQERTRTCNCRCIGTRSAMACTYVCIYIRMYTGRMKSPDYPYSSARARVR